MVASFTGNVLQVDLTAGIVASQQVVGGLPSRNFNEGTLSGLE